MYPRIISVKYHTKKCPICGGKIYNPCLDNDIPINGCTLSESCDEGGGTTGYHVVCFNYEKDNV